MTQPVSLRTLAATPAAGFEQPFEMLETCHERVHRMLALLDRLVAHVREVGCDTQAQQAARDVMRYFDQAAPQHHRDEELHVFPPLLAHGDPATLALVAQLQQDHLQMESRWSAARRVLADLAEARVDSLPGDQQQLLTLFGTLYGDHIRAEEDIAYPNAHALLDGEALLAMGREMMRRRGVA